MNEAEEGDHHGGSSSSATGLCSGADRARLGCCPPCQATDGALATDERTERVTAGSVTAGSEATQPAETQPEVDDADVERAGDALAEPAVEPETVAPAGPSDDGHFSAPWYPSRHITFRRGSSELDVHVMYYAIALAQGLRALPAFELIELQWLLVQLGVERERVRLRSFGAACNPHRRDWSSVRVMVIRYDCRDMVSEGSTDLFGGCGLDSQAAEVPLAP